MKIFKPKFWLDDKINVLSVLLFPFSAIYMIIHSIKRKLSLEKKFNIPVICVGNIYIGGTGKTPLSILIANELSQKGKKTAIIKKFYNNHIDEHHLTKKYFSNVILKKNRSKAIQEAIDHNYDVLVLDDGFQDYSFKKNLNILCFNSNQLIGNGLIFPSGPLRESLDAVKDSQIIVINGVRNLTFEEKILNINPEVSFYYSEYKIKNINELKNKKLLAVAGIGNPRNFFELLEKNGLDVKEKQSYPDHYNFSKQEILDLINKANQKNLHLVLTEKDFLRVEKYKLDQVKYSRVELEIKRKNELINEIDKICN